MIHLPVRYPIPALKCPYQNPPSSSSDHQP
eukprot:UN10572